MLHQRSRAQGTIGCGTVAVQVDVDWHGISGLAGYCRLHGAFNYYAVTNSRWLRQLPVPGFYYRPSPFIQDPLMLYAIIATDHPASLAKRLEARPAHLQRLQALQDQGRLVLAGPHPAIDSNDPGQAGFTGSLVVAEFDSLEQAQAWAAADPYQAAGVYAAVQVKPFKQVFPSQG
jgi:hypothetical protein